MRIKSIILILLLTSFFAHGQYETEIYEKIILEYVLSLKPPNIDYSSGITLTVLRRPNYMHKLDIKDFDRFKEKYENLDLQTFTNFINNNQLDSQFEKLEMPGMELVIIENESIPSWAELNSLYPNWIFSILEFSNIGFNESKNQALVYYAFDSGSGVGGGFYMVYEKKRRKWKQQGFIPAWAA